MLRVSNINITIAHFHINNNSGNQLTITCFSYQLYALEDQLEQLRSGLFFFGEGYSYRLFMQNPFAAQLKKIISLFESRQRSLGHYITIASKLGHYVEELRKNVEFQNSTFSYPEVLPEIYLKKTKYLSQLYITTKSNML